MRVVTIVVFGIGVFTVAPRMYFNPDESNWWVPAVAIGSAVPLVLLAFLSAPFVSTVRVLLPPSARKSHEALLRFAEQVPDDTRLSLQTMRWLPWPTHKEVYFSDLRRLPGWAGSANLEHVPLGHEKAANAANANKIFGGSLALRMYGRYWVDLNSRNKSQAPGVWEKMWDQITIKGQQPVKRVPKVAPKDRKPPGMVNRPAPVTPSVGGARKKPPGPVKKFGSKGGRSRG